MTRGAGHPVTARLGLAGGHTDRAALEHLLGEAVEAVVAGHGPVGLVCTHYVDGTVAGSVELTGPAAAVADVTAGLVDRLGVAVAAEAVDGPRLVAGDPAWAAAAGRALDALAQRSSGRAVVFPGQHRLTGEVPADAVPALSAVAEVVGIDGTLVAGATLLTRVFVRPVLTGGRLVLQVRPIGPDGAVAPFEVPDPTPCCAAHG